MGLNSQEERRRNPRFSVKLPLDFWQTLEVVQGGLVTDMSEAGLGIRSTHEIQIGVELKIRVYLPRAHLSKEGYSFDSIEGTGRIIWRTTHREQDWKGYRYGMYILKMASDSRDRLIKYILMLQGEENSSHQKRSLDRLRNLALEGLSGSIPTLSNNTLASISSGAFRNTTV